LHCYRKLTGPDLLRIVFNPAWMGEYLLELLLGGLPRTTRCIK
jgi:hypothetical protein